MSLFAMAFLATSTKPTRLLEITTRPYLYGLSQKLGQQITSVRQIPDSEFVDWKKKGFEWVWFMGIWQTGELGLIHDRTNPNLKSSYDKVLPGWTNDDVIGSPYSIVKYSISNQVGTADDLRWLRKKLNQFGMKLMVDFVPNHSACDAPEVDTKKNFYIRSPQGQPIDPKRFMPNGIAYGCGMWCDPWTDVAQYNYFDSEFQKHQLEVLKYIGSIADGARCDMAHLILKDNFWDYWQNELKAYGYTKPTTEFWKTATTTVKSLYPNFVFMAESYGDTLNALITCGFDYVYDKEPLDQLFYHNVDKFKQIFWNSDLSWKEHMAHFTENHDEPRSVEHFWNWAPAANAAAAALLTLPGLRFVNQDQWKGYANKIDVHLRRAAPEPEKKEVIDFYDKLFEVLDTDALKSGQFTQLDCEGGANVISWRWATGTQHILVAVNFGDGVGQGSIKLDDAVGTGNIKMTDLMTGTVYERSAPELRTKGLYVVLQSYQVQIFEY